MGLKSIVLVFFVSHLTMAKSVLTIKLNNIKKDQGQILISVFEQADGFPTKFQKALKNIAIDAAKYLENDEIVVDLKDQTSVAISVVHDLNSNNKMDTNLFGIPKEPFGFSNNVMNPFGPPNFEQAAFNPQIDDFIEIDLKSF